MAKRISFRTADGKRVSFTVKGKRAKARAKVKRVCARRGKQIIRIKTRNGIVSFCARR